MGKQSKIERANAHLKHVYNTQLTETTMFSSFLLRDSLSDEEIDARKRQMRSANASKVAAYYELLANADPLVAHILARHKPHLLAMYGIECSTCVYGEYADREEWPCPEMYSIFTFLECE